MAELTHVIGQIELVPEIGIYYVFAGSDWFKSPCCLMPYGSDETHQNWCNSMKQKEFHVQWLHGVLCISIGMSTEYPQE